MSRLRAPSILARRRHTVRRGSVIVEYAILAAVLCAAVFLALEQWSREAKRTFQSVGRTIVNRDVGASPAERQKPVVDVANTPDGGVGQNWLGTAVLAITIFAWLAERIGRRRANAAISALTAAKIATPVHDAADAARGRCAEKRLQILNALLKDNHKLLPSDLRVSDLMSQELKTAASHTSVAEVRKLLEENNVRHVLICDAHDRLVGIVSDRDIKDVDDLTAVDKVMAARPTTVTSDSLVNNAITTLLHGHFSSLPVVDGERLVGILTTTDVVMTLQCAMLAVEQIVVDLRTRRDCFELETFVW